MSNPGTNEHFDVVIVGARCAGSPLAILLKRAGLSVCVVDQAGFPSDALSTHMFQISGIEVMQKLGIFDDVLATNAPPVTTCHMRFEDVDFSGPPRVREGDPPVPMLCVRRISLDVILVEKARAEGVDVRLHTRVTGLVEKDGRVAGIRVAARDGHASTISAGLVVGADGRLSTIARLVGARRYHVLPSERLSTWAYFSGVPREPEARLFYFRQGDEFIVASPTDNDLFLAISCPSVEQSPAYRADGEGAFNRAVATCEPLADLLSGAKRETKFRGLTRFEGYFREAAGPGWVLVGDSGHFKEPTPGQGISDALRQVDKLSAAIVRGFAARGRLDAELRGWWRWRDRDSIQHYWFCFDVGRRGPISPVRLEILRAVAANDEWRMDFLDIFMHRKYPRQVLRPTTLAAATARALANPAKRPGALRDAYALAREDVSRRFQAWFPRLNEKAAVDEPHLDHQPSAA
ncbi:MAG TPA: NAD(P)/FAD-dependent oxidoreductase [Pyrinomonadaceae bacterium]|jgi:2-polyprenyl-6-methoxyphenol hydroxylase-like FAD-dependent oxidoreductase